MQLTILGAGAVGPAAAALAVSRGHGATLWSPRGGGTHGIGAALTAEGALSGTARVDVAVDLGRAVAAAEAVLVSVPPHALGPVLRRVAPMLREGIPVILAPGHSLATLLLDRLLAMRGVRVPVGSMSLPPVVAARTAPDRVRILSIRERVEIATVPAAESGAMARLCADLFGLPFVALGDALGAALATSEPVLQAAVAMGNLTRIEGAETWDLHGGMTPAVCRVMAGLDAERLALARAYGHRVDPLPLQLHRATGVPEGSLPAMARGMAETLGPTPGPRGLDAAHLAESVTYGLGLWLRLAEPKRIAMPLTAAAVALLETMWGTTLTSDDLLEGLDMSQLAGLLREGHPR
jgi:opine dehydrogenase